MQSFILKEVGVHTREVSIVYFVTAIITIQAINDYFDILNGVDITSVICLSMSTLIILHINDAIFSLTMLPFVMFSLSISFTIYS